MQVQFEDFQTSHAHIPAFTAVNGLLFSVVVMHVFMVCWHLHLNLDEQRALCIMFDRFYAFHMLVVIVLICILSISDTNKGI